MSVSPAPPPRHLPPWHVVETEFEPRRPRATAVSVLLWQAAAVACAAGVVLAVADLDQVRAALSADVVRQFPNESLETWDRVVTAALAVIVGVGAVIPLLQLGFALAMRSRRRWARMVLIVVGLLEAGHVVIALGALPRPALVGLGSAVGLAVVATFAMFLPASNKWLSSRGGRS